MKVKRFTFRKGEQATGLAHVTFPFPETIIKLGGRECGWIHPPNARRAKGWDVVFIVDKDADHDDGNPNCSWMNLRVAGPFNSEPDARAWVNEHAEELQTKYRLHMVEG